MNEQRGYRAARLGLPLVLISAAAAIAACSNEPEPMDPSAVQPGYTQPGYTQPGYTQPGYTQPGYTQPGYTQPAATTPATTTAPMSTGALPIPCQADTGCGTHRCNTTSQTCAVPCTGPQDCQTGNACTMGVCLPGGGQ